MYLSSTATVAWGDAFRPENDDVAPLKLPGLALTRGESLRGLEFRVNDRYTALFNSVVFRRENLEFQSFSGDNTYTLQRWVSAVCRNPKPFKK